tara:strand:- start:146 stop:337 length:192 start_codon:yes stop_codon:yes gene_type:complete
MIKSQRYQFIEKVFEIAFGDDAINRSFTYEEVIEKLQEYSDNSLMVEEIEYLAKNKIKEKLHD